MNRNKSIAMNLRRFANSLAPSKQEVRLPSVGNLAGYLAGTAVQNQIRQVAGKKAETFIASLTSAVQTTPALKECTNASLVTAALLVIVISIGAIAVAIVITKKRNGK